MKIKVLLAKYLAWVVLALLGAVLAYTALRTLRPETGFDKLKVEIGRSERTIKSGMDEPKAPPKPVPDYVGKLKARFDHPPVLNRLRHNPFVTNRVVEYPLIQFVKDQIREVRLKGVRLTEVVPAPETHVKVVEIKWIPEEDTSIVTFKAIEPGDAAFQILTVDEVVSYLFNFSVLKVRKPDEPLPPADVTILAHAAKEAHGRKERALVLVTFFPDNRTLVMGVRIGPSNHAAIYRKPANASDAEYVILRVIAPATAADLQLIRRRFSPEDEVVREVAPPPKPAISGEPPVPETAPNFAPPKSAEPGRAGITRLQPGAFAFLDDTVDDGESYVYKIVTLNVQPGLQTAECREPYISLPPIAVPSLVEFTVVSVGGGRAKLSLTRLDPDTGQPISWTGNFTIGMKIGGKERIRLTEAGRVGYKDVDFSTGCTLVDALGSFKDISYAPVKASRTVPLVFSARRLVTDPSILYLTPRGNALRLRSKSDSSATTFAPLPAGPP